MISGSEVIDPCPISVAADRIVIVPSVPMLIHGLSAMPDRAAVSTDAPASPACAMANDMPAAPTITWRREIGVFKLLMCWFMSRLPRRALDGAHDALIGAAAADVGAHVLDDLGARRLRFL